MSFEEACLAAEICRRYAAAVESHLYMNMSVEQAHEAIQVANRLAKVIDEYAEKIDSVTPADIG